MDCADADPSLTIPGTGGSDMILVLEPKSFKPFKSKDEYMYAMKEDLAEWFTCLYKCCITVDNFFEVLETGVELCKHANAVRKFAIEQQDQIGNKSQFIRHIPNGEIQYKKEVKSQTFQARDNVSNFISWCRDIGVPEVLRFETDDLVLRKNERSVVLCLLEVARVGAKLGMLAPTIVQMEEEIDAELAGEPPPPTKQIITCDLKSLDEMVRELVGKCTCPSQFPIIKVGEGKYKIGDSQTLIFVRILRNHVMVRVGGGWDTLENYLDKHDPCRCNFKGHRGSNQSPAVKRPQVRRSSAPSSQILADHINQRSPKKTPLSSSSCKQGGYVMGTPPRSESPVSGRSGKRSSCQTSSAECSQHSSTENLHRTPCQSPAKHSSKMLPPSSVGKTPTSPAKRAASPASTSSLASSSLRSSASSSLSASSEKLNSSESKSSGGRLDMDQISTMTLEQFKNLLNNQLVTTAKEQAPSIESSSRLTRQKAEIGSTSNKLQNPSTKNTIPNLNGQGRGPKQTSLGRSADQSPDISRRMRSPSPNLQGQSGENAAPEGPSSGLKPRGKRSGLSFLPRPNIQSTSQVNGESKIPMKRSGGTAIAQVPRPVTPSGETRAQRSLPTTPKQERKYNRTLPPRQMTEGSNIGKQVNSSTKRGTIMQRATTPGPRSQTPTKIENRRSSTPGLRELQIFSNTGNANLTDDTQSSADEESGGLKTPTPGRRSGPRSQSGLSSRSSSTHSLNLAVKGDIPIEDTRMTYNAAGYAERWRRNKRASSAVRGNVNASSPDLITVSRTQSGGHSVVFGKPSASEIRSGLGKASKSDLSKDSTDAIRRARSIARNTTSKIARSQSADRFSQRQRSGSISSVEDNGDTQWSRDRPQQRRLSELGIKTSTAARSNSLKYERSGRPRRGGSVTPNSIDVCDFDLSSRPLEEITAALIPVNGQVPQVSDPNELDAPPEDPEMYEQMEKLFEAYRQKELRDMVEATDRSKDSLTIPLDRQDDDDDSRGNNTDISSLDSNANLPISGQSSLTGSRRSSFQKTSDAESVEKMPGAVKEQNRTQSGGSRIPLSRIPGPRTCRIPAPKSKIGSGIPKSSGHQKNGVKTYSSIDYPDDNSASPNDSHDFLTSDQVSDNSRRTSYSDESSISTSDTSTNNLGQRLETPVPKVAKPLTTGRQRLIRPDIRLDKSKLVKAVSDNVGKDSSHYGQKYLHDDEDDEDETF